MLFNRYVSVALVVTALGSSAFAAPQIGGIPGTMQNHVQGSADVFGTTIRLDFNANYMVGEYRYAGSQDYWVVAPYGLTITSKTPAYEYRGLQEFGMVNYEWHANGMHVNPDPSSTAQGLDSVSYQHGNINAPNYVHSMNLAAKLVQVGPQTVPPGSTLCVAVSKSQPFQRPQLESMMLVTVVAAAPPAGSFRPCYAGTDKSMPYRVQDLDFSKLHNLAVPPETSPPSWSVVESMVDGVLYEAPSNRNQRRYHRADAHFPNYGRDLSAVLSVPYLMVQLDYTNEQKAKTVYDLVQIGLDRWKISTEDRWGSPSNPNGHWFGDAGQSALHKWSIMFAGLLLDDGLIQAEAELAPNPNSLTQLWMEDNQMFVVKETAPYVYNYGVCGYGPTPVGGANWIPAGTPEWGISHWEQAITGQSLDDMAAWDPEMTSHPNYPLMANGEPCPMTANNYRSCCTASVWWAQNFSARLMGVASETFRPAFYHYMKDRFIQQNAVWSSEAQNFFQGPGVPPSAEGFVERIWNYYGTDYTQWPIPALTSVW